MSLHRIEKNALGHFKYLPEISGYSVSQQDNLTLINSGLGTSMFNIAYGGLPETEEAISTLIDTYKGQPFALWIPPSKISEALSQKLLECGFVVEAPEYAMICDLSAYQPTQKDLEGFEIKQVKDVRTLEDFIQILASYDAVAEQFYKSLTLDQLQQQETLYVGYAEGKPACISILYQEGDSAAIFSLITLESMRGRGFGTCMMHYLMHKAQESQCKTITLSASSDSGFRIYERLGFETLGRFDCFEWA